MYDRNGVLGVEHNSQGYELNVPQFKRLIALLSKRKSSSKKWELIRNKILGETGQEKKLWFKAYGIYLKDMAQFKNRLEREFEYDKLILNPNGEEGIPFFDLQYVLKDTDLKKWAHVIRLELEYRGRFNVPKRGRKNKESVYTREVFLTYEKFLTDAKKNKASIDKKPVHWAADKTVELFHKRDKIKIYANTLIRLAKSRVGKKLDKNLFS